MAFGGSSPVCLSSCGEVLPRLVLKPYLLSASCESLNPSLNPRKRTSIKSSEFSQIRPALVSRCSICQNTLAEGPPTPHVRARPKRPVAAKTSFRNGNQSDRARTSKAAVRTAANAATATVAVSPNATAAAASAMRRNRSLVRQHSQSYYQRHGGIDFVITVMSSIRVEAVET